MVRSLQSDSGVRPDLRAQRRPSEIEVEARELEHCAALEHGGAELDGLDEPHQLELRDHLEPTIEVHQENADR